MNEELKRAHTIVSRLLAMKRPLSAEELAEILGVSKVTLLRWAKRGIIPSMRFRNIIKFDPVTSARWVVAQGGQMMRKPAKRNLRRFVEIKSR